MQPRSSGSSQIGSAPASASTADRRVKPRARPRRGSANPGVICGALAVTSGLEGFRAVIQSSGTNARSPRATDGSVWSSGLWDTGLAAKHRKSIGHGRWGRREVGMGVGVEQAGIKGIVYARAGGGVVRVVMGGRGE